MASLENLRENWDIVSNQLLMTYSYTLRLMHLSTSWEMLLFEVDANQHRAHNWPRCRNEDILEYPSHGTIIFYTSRFRERPKEPEVVYDYTETLSSGYSRKREHMNIPRLWYHTQYLCEPKPDQIPSWGWEMVMKS